MFITSRCIILSSRPSPVKKTLQEIAKEADREKRREEAKKRNEERRRKREERKNNPVKGSENIQSFHAIKVLPFSH